MTETEHTNQELEELQSVEIDALVILRIMKHCRANLPQLATGQLLGLDVQEVLQVTNCFEQPQSGEEVLMDADEDYQMTMLRMLRDVNIDANTVGWYQSTYLGGFLTEKLVEVMASYHESIKKSIVLIYDPLQDTIGKCAFKAYRLKDQFFQRYVESRKTGITCNLKDLNSDDVFVEIPITIHNPLLVEAYLVEWAMGDPRSMNVQFESLDLENQTFLEKNVSFLLECLDDLTQEQQKLQYYERQAIRQQQQQKNFVEKRRAENNARLERGQDLLAEAEAPAFKRIQLPSQLETLLISNQIQTYCKQINSYASDSFGKLFLVSGFQKAN
jgi:translation initiation factor 3 subunit H